MTEKNPAIFLQAGSHPAEDVRRFVGAVAIFGGVVGMNDLAVSQNGTPNMTVSVAGGRAFIPGDEGTYQGTYFVENRSTTSLAIATADATNPRIDLVVAKVQDAGYSGATNAWSLAVVTGTPAASPSAPTKPANSIVLARIAVAAGDTAINTADITDYRFAQTGQSLVTAPGGTVTCLSTNRPASPWEGLKIYETDTNRFWVYNGSAWRLLGGYNQPRVRVKRSGAQTIANSTNTDITWDQEDWDTDSMHSTSSNTNRLTCPTGMDGDWHVSFYVTWAQNAVGTRAVWFLVNGANPRWAGIETVNSTASYGVAQAGGSVVRLAAGDYVTLQVVQFSGGNLACINDVQNYFAMTRIGGS